jgi:hypothetical protein
VVQNLYLPDWPDIAKIGHLKSATYVAFNYTPYGPCRIAELLAARLVAQV